MSAKAIKSEHVISPDLAELEVYFQSWLIAMSQTVDFQQESYIQCARLGYMQGWHSGFESAKLQYQTKKLM